MPTMIDRDRVLELMEQGAQLVEVLGPGEYRSGHLPGAVNIPYKQFEADTVADLDRDRPVIVYCSGFM